MGKLADGEIGDTALLYQTASTKSAPRRMGPALTLNIEGAGTTAKFHPHTLKAARFCAQGKVEEKVVEDNELDPLHGRLRTVGPALRGNQGLQDVEDEMEVDAEEGTCNSSTGALQSGPGRYPAATPAPDSPTLSV